MQLRYFLASHEITYTAFGARLGVSRQTVRRWAEGECMPRRHHLEQITRVTAGAVLPNDFLQLMAGAA